MNDPEVLASAPRKMTRRTAVAAAVMGGAAAMTAGSATPQSLADDATSRATSTRMPVLYLPHGGGPWPFVDLRFSSRSETEALTAYLVSVAAIAPAKPRALLVVSAHWEAPTPTVMTGERPPLYFDYYGFPPETYRLTWPAPGDPRLAARTRELLGKAGFASAEDAERGFDHGTFVPLKVTYPAAEVPTVQLSLKNGLDPVEHIAIGRALAPLRDEGILIVGSGMSYHNMRGFGGAGLSASVAFDAWLRETTLSDPEVRNRRLSSWTDAPSARQAHPREEHLMPLMVIAGAAGSERGRVAFDGSFAGVRISAHHFG
ncbi:MAG: class III extradiol ring-cleavage dioxygenase [Polyangiaceae bacterium]|jgi:aromatic ring-opening dioxygenase catalytic subunit (LigB family)